MKNKVYNILTGFLILTCIATVYGAYQYKQNGWRPFQEISGVYIKHSDYGMIRKLEFNDSQYCTITPFVIGKTVKHPYKIVDKHLYIGKGEKAFVYHILDNKQILEGDFIIGTLKKIE